MLSFDGQDVAMTPIIKLNYIDPEEAKTMTAEEIKARATRKATRAKRISTRSTSVWCVWHSKDAWQRTSTGRRSCR